MVKFGAVGTNLITVDRRIIVQMHHLLEHTSHRPYSEPPTPWLMEQTWVDLLFMHWPITSDRLRPLIPEPLEIDTYDGQAWIGVVPFGMTNVYFRNVPSVPYLSRFLELNVRSYVRFQGKSGVYFFSLDASNPVAVEVARLWFHLPYFRAQMSKCSDAGKFFYTSERIDSRGRQSEFAAAYRPTGEPYFSKKKRLKRG